MPEGHAAQAGSSPEPAFDGLTFEAIETAVKETARGRWFLDEYARRIRAAELNRIEGALSRIEQRLPSPSAPMRDAETRIVALSVHQRLVDLAAALRESGVGEDACARIEAQAQALLDLARRRNLMDAHEMLEQGLTGARAAPAA